MPKELSPVFSFFRLCLLSSHLQAQSSTKDPFYKKIYCTRVPILSVASHQIFNLDVFSPHRVKRVGAQSSRKAVERPKETVIYMQVFYSMFFYTLVQVE